MNKHSIKKPKELLELISDSRAKTHCLLDIDEFSTFNHTHGHLCGNNLLIELFRIISSKLSPLHLFYIGSDEFYFSFDNEDNKKKCTEFLSYIKQQLRITVSIGIVDITKPVPPNALMNQLKSNVVLAKANGKNLICYL